MSIPTSSIKISKNWPKGYSTVIQRLEIRIEMRNQSSEKKQIMRIGTYASFTQFVPGETSWLDLNNGHRRSYSRQHSL
jgi:hypothetical protein